MFILMVLASAESSLASCAFFIDETVEQHHALLLVDEEKLRAIGSATESCELVKGPNHGLQPAYDWPANSTVLMAATTRFLVVA